MAKNSTRRPAARAKVDWRAKSSDFDLAVWYSAEDAKRSFGSICRAVNVQGTNVLLLGTEDRPLLVLTPANRTPASQFQIPLTIDEAKADWSAVTAASCLYGSVFRVSGSHHEHAVLQRHQINRHGATRYRRPQLEDIPLNVGLLLDDLQEISDKFSATTTLIDRRFKEVWRDQNVVSR